MAEHLRARVRRAGHAKPISIPWNRVVEGDIVLVETGDVMLADVRLIKMEEPMIVRPPLTRTVPLRCRQLKAEEEPNQMLFSEASNMIWSGAMVMRGKGEGVVVHTADHCLQYLFSDHVKAFNMMSQKKLQKKRQIESLFGVVVHPYLLLGIFGDYDILDFKMVYSSFVLHYQSPLLSWVRKEKDPVVDEVLVGPNFDLVVSGKDEVILEEIRTCCSVASSSTLSLEDIKKWVRGEISATDIKSEKGRDAVGSSLLRWSVSQLGAKSWWSKRAAGFKVFVNEATNATLSYMESKRCSYFRCNVDEALQSCKYYMTSSGNVKSINSEYVASLQSKAMSCSSMRKKVVILAKYKGEWENKIQKNGIVLGLIVMKESEQTRRELKRAIKILQRRLGLKFILRCNDSTEVDDCIAKGLDLKIWTKSETGKEGRMFWLKEFWCVSCFDFYFQRDAIFCFQWWKCWRLDSR